MSDTTKTQLDLELMRLAKRIEELVATVEHLKEENRALRQRHESLGRRACLAPPEERTGRTRVEAMIGRLKTLEHGSMSMQEQARVSVRIWRRSTSSPVRMRNAPRSWTPLNS